jgi:uncharacterized membrane protein YphA (DoxX/SURF4 family)
MFPAGAAGVALFALRASVIASLLVDCYVHGSQANSTWVFVGPGITALLLCLGLFTPYCSVFCALLETAFLVRHGSSDEFHLAVNLLNSLILALLGPGAYSIDARIFGRRRLILPPRR